MSASPPSPVLRDWVLQGRLALVRPRRIEAPRAGVSIDEAAPQQADPGTEPPARPAAIEEEARRVGHDQGFAQGLAEGRARSDEEAGNARALQADRLTRELTQQFEARYGHRIERLDALLAALPPQIDARLAAAEDDLAALCFETICRVLGAHAIRPEAIRAQLSQALKALRGRHLVAVHLHPDDLAALRADGEPAPIGFARDDIEWIASAEVACGGCILQSPEGGLDARLDTQLNALREALLHARTEGPQ